MRKTVDVIGTPIDIVGWDAAVNRINGWASLRESRVIYICNAHSLVTARHDKSFGRVLSLADMATPDGAPVAYMARRLGFPLQDRINGPDLMLRYCQQASTVGVSIYLYGASAETLSALGEKLKELVPDLRIAGQHSPPFRDLTDKEKEEIVHNINCSGAGIVWVSLGCPKQEKWMAEHRGKIRAVMVGVGAAFDYHAGTIKRAPIWMQRNGLEWLYRLLSEPRRLWRRYFVTNTLFIWHAAKQLLRYAN